jgi:hypothetical protein
MFISDWSALITLQKAPPGQHAYTFMIRILLTSLTSVSFLCTGGLSDALFISLLISKLFCTKGFMGEGGGAGHSKFTSSR